MLRFITTLIISLLLLSSFAQKVTLSFSNQSLTQVLQILNNHYQFKFAYDNDKTDHILIDDHFSNAKIDDVLTAILEGSGLTYNLINGAYVIVPANENNSLSVKSSQYKKITGLILDKNTGEHLPYTSIQTVSNKSGTLANRDGFFTIWTTSTDSLALKISFIG